MEHGLLRGRRISVAVHDRPVIGATHEGDEGTGIKRRCAKSLASLQRHAALPPQD